MAAQDVSVSSASDGDVAQRLHAEVVGERAAGLAKSWRSVTRLLDEYRVGTLDSDVAGRVVASLAAVGVRISPSLDSVSRQDRVRLLLEHEDPEAVQDLLGRNLVSATHWLPAAYPQHLDLNGLSALPHDGVVWFDVRPEAEPASLMEVLGPLLPDLPAAAVEDVLQVDDLPAVAQYGEVRKVSSFVVSANENTGAEPPRDESKVGDLVFQTVELLVGEGWLLSCWHEPRGTIEATGAKPARSSVVQASAGVATAWTKRESPSVGVLGLLVLEELARSFGPARRTLYSWLEQWELDFHRIGAPIEQDTLRDLRFLIVEFQRRLNSLNESRLAVAEHSWFARDIPEDLDRQMDAILISSIEGLVNVSGVLRSAVDLLTTAGIRQQLHKADEAARKAERLQDQVGLVASVLLVPTFIAGLFGANTLVPGQQHWSGFVLMLVLMAAGSFGTYSFFRRAKRRGDGGGPPGS